jgi:conjugal transfer pilus assembly protein TraV
MKPHSEQKKDKKSDKNGQNHDSGSPQPQTAESAYNEYKERTYRELAGLVDQGHTPMLKPATTIRTLILPYSPRNQGESIFMPRFVYSVYDQPKWVLGEYLYRDPSIFKGLVDGKGYSK